MIVRFEDKLNMKNVLIKTMETINGLFFGGNLIFEKNSLKINTSNALNTSYIEINIKKSL